jgi:uncharacterized membrane protein
MPSDHSPSDPRTEWQSQPTEDFRMSRALLERYISASHRRLRLLSIAQYAGASMGVVGFAFIASRANGAMMQIGAALLALVFAFVLVLLRRTAGPRNAASATAAPFIDFYRADLERHRNLSTGFRLWSRLVIGVPVVCVFFIGFARANPSITRFIYIEAAAVIAALGIAFVSTHRRARRYQQEIDELDALRH